MLVVLTYYGTGNPTLVNLNNVETLYQVADKYQGRLSTKIQFQGGNFINVVEDLQTILKIQWGMMNGVSQDLEFETPSIDTMLEQSYQQRERGYSKKKYHREENDYFSNKY